MKPLAADDVRGVWGTLLLPLDPGGEICWQQLSDQLDILLSSGVDGVYVHGTAGEFHTLREDEYDRVNEIVVSRCEALGTPFQIGASHPAVPVMLDHIRSATAVAPGAIQVILPNWVPMSGEEVVRFMEGAATAAKGRPLVLYNPPHAKTNVSPRLMGRVIEAVPSVIGVKMAGGDDAWFEAMRALPACSIFVPGHLLASGLTRGAHGSYSNVAALSPRGAVAWYQLMASDMGAALDVERRIGEFFRRHIAPLQAIGLSNPALDKFLAVVGNWADIGLGTRWPASAAPEDAVAPARVTAHELLPELFRHDP